MKTSILFVLGLLIAVAYSENCVTKYDCIDVGCSHHSTVICENHICTCSPIKEEFTCKSVGDCERHIGICGTQWNCIGHVCKCN